MAGSPGNFARRTARAWVDAAPMARLLTVSAAAASVWLGAGAADLLVGAGLAVAGVALVAGALVDHVEQRIPNALVGIALAVAVAAPLLAVELTAVGTALVGGVVAASALLIVRLARGIGMGDVKMGAAVGASSGSLVLLAAPVAVALSSFSVAVFGLVSGRRRVALGPWLWLGWAAALGLVHVGLVQ